MKKSGIKQKGFVIGMAVAILLPLSFFITAKLLGKDKIYMPQYYLPTDTTVVRIKSDSARYFQGRLLQANDLRGVNQLGDEVSLNSEALKGKVLVVNFFFTSCPTICPRLTKCMQMLQTAYRRTDMKQNDELVQFISITVNPERDTIPALRAYADRYGANHDHWWFLTGDKKSIYSYARRDLHLSVGDGDGGADDFIHPELFVLLDKDRFVRGYYDVLNDSAALRHCATDIALLDMEKKR